MSNDSFEWEVPSHSWLSGMVRDTHLNNYGELQRALASFTSRSSGCASFVELPSPEMMLSQIHIVVVDEEGEEY